MLLSLDVGFRKTGWTVFDQGMPKECGIAQQPKSTKRGVRTADDNVFRAGQLVSTLKDVIEGWSCKAVIGELPSGGAQSATAMRDMAAATCAVAGLVTCMDLPCEWCTPTEVKVAATGLKSGTKEEIMLAVADRYDWSYDVKTSANKKGTTVKRYTFDVLGKRYPGGVFEDIADSIAAYWALGNCNMVKMFG
jgi:Holliday junction resolvasome RuvABC endonuclease subunit